MILYYIKILGIIIVTVCCVIATYTDVKRQVIPNKLTFSTLFLGILLVSFYYYLINNFNIFYYISIVIVFIFAYVLWKMGVWAGGDVKLFTAISSLLIPEFLDVLPNYMFFGMSLPLNVLNINIPTFLLIFNSVLSIMPIVLLIILSIIIKEKHYLIKELFDSLNFKEVFLSLNSLMIGYVIISSINVYSPIKIVILIIVSLLISQIIKYDILLLIISLAIFIQQLLDANILLYLEELLIISLIVSIINIYKKGIVKEALTKNIDVNNLEEGMILSYPLCYRNNRYFFDKRGIFKNIKDKLNNSDTEEEICGIEAKGIDKKDIDLIKQIHYIKVVPIKRGLSFAPFILCGLVITFSIGNTVELIRILLELI